MIALAGVIYAAGFVIALAEILYIVFRRKDADEIGTIPSPPERDSFDTATAVLAEIRRQDLATIKRQAQELFEVRAELAALKRAQPSTRG